MLGHRPAIKPPVTISSGKQSADLENDESTYSEEQENCNEDSNNVDISASTADQVSNGILLFLVFRFDTEFFFRNLY